MSDILLRYGEESERGSLDSSKLAILEGQLSIAYKNTPNLSDYITLPSKDARIYFDLTDTERIPVNAYFADHAQDAKEAIALRGLSSTIGELNSLAGITGNVQEQLDDKVSYTPTNLGSMANKTIPELQAALDGWLSSVLSSGAKSGARATFDTTNAFVSWWNAGNTTSTLPSGITWTVELVSTYPTKDYVQLMITTYSSKQVYYVTRSKGTWQNIYEVAFTNDIPTYTLSSFGLTATATELNYVDGVTSNIQEQLDSRVATTGGYVNKNIAWNTNSYLQNVILLFPVPQSTTYTGHNYIDGRFFLYKQGGNVWDVIEISANCVYGTLEYNLQAFGQTAGGLKLCVCTYNGTQYYALKCPYHANPYFQCYFTGRTPHDGMPLSVAYYDENTKTVLNSEVYNSLTDTLTTSSVYAVYNNPLYSKGGFVGKLEGNADTATTASYYHSPKNTGYQTDDHGNFQHLNSSSIDYFNIYSNNKNTALQYYYETGILKVPSTIYSNSSPVITSANIGSQSVNYANSAGQASRIPVYTSDPTSLTAGQIWINTSV